MPDDKHADTDRWTGDEQDPTPEQTGGVAGSQMILDDPDNNDGSDTDDSGVGRPVLRPDDGHTIAPASASATDGATPHASVRRATTEEDIAPAVPEDRNTSIDRGANDASTPQSERADRATAFLPPHEESDDSGDSGTDDGETGCVAPRSNDKRTAIPTNTLTSEGTPPPCSRSTRGWGRNRCSPSPLPSSMRAATSSDMEPRRPNGTRHSRQGSGRHMAERHSKKGLHPHDHPKQQVRYAFAWRCAPAITGTN